MGHEISILDIGGGFPWEYKGRDFDFIEFCSPIRDALAEVSPSIKILAEPGRFISTTCITLVSSVVGYVQKEDTLWYYLDEGFYGLYA